MDKRLLAFIPLAITGFVLFQASGRESFSTEVLQLLAVGACSIPIGLVIAFVLKKKPLLKIGVAFGLLISLAVTLVFDTFGWPNIP